MPSTSRPELAARLDASPARWSVLVIDPASGETLIEHAPDATLRTASAAKILLLVEVARRIETGEFDPAALLPRDSATRVADSGIWQHLHVDALSVDDIARLVGLASDNWATNVLLRRVGGVAQIAETASRAGIDGIALHDEVRDERAAPHPPTLSTGSARGYAGILSRLHAGTAVDTATSARVLGWLRGGLDLSMVAAAFGLDPLAHDGPDRGLTVIGKTGTDAGIRVDVGIVTGPRRTLVYACLANWTPTDAVDAERDHVLDLMRDIGREIRAAVSNAG